jgi:hypothetical protein
MTEPVTATHPALVLHALRVCGFATTDGVAAFLGQSTDEVAELLARGESDGHLRFRDGRMSGWLLTAPGRAHHNEHLQQDLSQAQWKADVEAAYGEFVARNVELKQVCTDWQLRPSDGADLLPNDHTDAAYDGRVIASLAALHDRSVPMVDRLSGVLPRFASYRPRLAGALARLRAGDVTAFARPMSASYHCVWMELHEDLLATLCRERGEADGH